MKALKRLNDGLPTMVGTIILYGVIAEAVGVWFFNDKLKFTIGLIIGIICAVGMVINIASVLYDVVSGDASPKVVAIKSVLRYVIVFLIFCLMVYFDFGSLISAFIGVMGLKISAYIYPFITKKSEVPSKKSESGKDKKSK